MSDDPIHRRFLKLRRLMVPYAEGKYRPLTNREARIHARAPSNVMKLVGAIDRDMMPGSEPGMEKS